MCDLNVTFYLPEDNFDDNQKHFVIEHDCPKHPFMGEPPYRRVSWFPYGGTENPANWTLVSENPLTITPSILSSCCGIHGFITDDKWVSV